MGKVDTTLKADRIRSLFSSGYFVSREHHNWQYQCRPHRRHHQCHWAMGDSPVAHHTCDYAIAFDNRHQPIDLASKNVGSFFFLLHLASFSDLARD